VISHPNQKPYIPPACYTLTSSEKTAFPEALKDLKVPDGYSSNISRGVSLKDRKLFNLKSHDCHILMQDLLPIVCQASMHSQSHARVVMVIIKLCSYLKKLCAKVLDLSKLDKLQYEIAKTLCEMEQQFPPSFSLLWCT